MNRRLAIAALVLAAAHSAAASDHVAYANVLWSEPLYATNQKARRHCTLPAAAGPVANLRAQRPTLTLARAIEEAVDQAAEQAVTGAAGRYPVSGRAVCEETANPIVAYRVAFRHAGRMWIRTVADRPGETIAVQVTVRAADLSHPR